MTDTKPELPADVELEQALLGSCIVWNEIIPDVEAQCSPEDFYHSPHPQIAKAIFALNRNGARVTPLTLAAAVNDLKGLEGDDGTIDWRVYFANMASASPSNKSPFLANLIADLRCRRDCVTALEIALEGVRDRSVSLTSALQPAQVAADEVTDRASKAIDTSNSEASHTLLLEIEAAMNGISVPKITTGLEGLDSVLGGLQAGDFCIYAGRPGMLKTGLLATTGYAAAISGAPVLFFELEMMRKQLLTRIACAVDYKKHPDDPMSYEWFRRGDVRDFQFHRLSDALREIPDNLRIFDRSGMTVHEIAAIARSHAKRSSKMGLVIIDYLQLVQAGERYRGNAVQEITEISKAVKTLAKTIGWPVLVACQLSRAVESREDKRPLLQDLRESGQLEQDADQVVGLYRAGYYIKQREPEPLSPQYPSWAAEFELAQNSMELLVRKNRHGRAEKVEVYCDMRSSVILDNKP